MNLEEKMRTYRNQMQIKASEESIRDTICKSKEAFYAKERHRLLTYREFLWAQFRLIRKRWWLLQMLLLIGVGLTLPSIRESFLLQRSMGIAGALFVILIIPELWKNKSWGCMEIEASSYYSLRQIYAARILIFGIMDIFLLTMFCTMLLRYSQIGPADFIAQFLLPMTVTACICFGLLCSRHSVSEHVSVVLCAVWSALWWLITVNEHIYNKITLPVWGMLLGISILVLAVAICRTLKNCSQSWELRFNE